MAKNLNSYFVKTHKLEISITIIYSFFLIYFLGAPHVLYRAFMQSMPFFGIIAISANLLSLLVRLIFSIYSWDNVSYH